MLLDTSAVVHRLPAKLKSEIRRLEITSKFHSCKVSWQCVAERPYGPTEAFLCETQGVSEEEVVIETGALVFQAEEGDEEENTVSRRNAEPPEQTRVVRVGVVREVWAGEGAVSCSWTHAHIDRPLGSIHT